MIVIRQSFIKREDLRANPKILYIFGDNLMREGLGGQAKEMRGEINAFGYATKRRPSHGSPEDYFHDGDRDIADIIYNEWGRLLDALTNHIDHRIWDALVIPLDGIGTGLAELPKYAPNMLNMINLQLDSLKGIYNAN